MNATEIEAGEALLAEQPLPKFEQAKALLLEAVAEAGDDHAYEKAYGEDACQYVQNGKPACLVGVVLHKFGWSVEALALLDTGNSGYGLDNADVLQDSVNLWQPLERGGPEHVLAGVLLRDAQNQQDRGFTWGTARDHALACVS